MNPVDISFYGIIDPVRSRGRDLIGLALAAVDGGVSLIQYRDKHSDRPKVLDIAGRLQEALADTGVPLIINDHVEIALACGAAGVHLGQEDMHATQARRLLGTKAIIGLSVKTIDDVSRLPAPVIDYVFVGGVFETASKNNPGAIGIEGWRQLAAAIRQRAPGMPVGAIAGIDRQNAAELVAAGADGIAVISALFMADNVTAAAHSLRSAMAGQHDPATP